MNKNAAFLDEIFKVLLKNHKIQDLCEVRLSLNRNFSDRIIQFPERCHKCQQEFGSAENFVKNTKTLAFPEESVAQKAATGNSYFDYRMCSCRTVLPFEFNNRRDNSKFGNRARQIFSECELQLSLELSMPPHLQKSLLREIFRQIISFGYFTLERADWNRINGDLIKYSARTKPAGKDSA